MRTIFAALVAAILADPAFAGTCVVADPAKVIETWRDHFEMRTVAKMEITVGDGVTVPAMILAKPTGEFTILYLNAGHVCELVEGKGMGPAPADLQFPVAATPDERDP